MSKFSKKWMGIRTLFDLFLMIYSPTWASISCYFQSTDENIQNSLLSKVWNKSFLQCFGKIPRKATEKETVNLQEPISSKQSNMPEFQSLRTWVCCIITVVPGSAVTTCAMLRWSCYKLCSVYLVWGKKESITGLHCHAIKNKNPNHSIN